MKKDKKGISLIALIITIAVIIIMSVSIIQNSLQRTEEAKLAKHNQNISMTQEEVENYYYYKGTELPVVNLTPYPIPAGTSLYNEILKNGEQADSFYVLDMSKLGKTAGKEGNGVGDDIYIVSSTRHNVYYVRGDTIKSVTYHGLIAKNDVKLAQITGSATSTPTSGPTATNTPTPPPGVDISGSGTVEDPYVIWTLTGLSKVSEHTSAYYKLGQNIDASQTSQPSYNAGKGWVPISAFGGNFDGMGYKISNLYINDSTRDNVGLFGSMYGTIKNLFIENSNITGKTAVGSLTGLCEGNVSGVAATGVVSGYQYVGGLLGEASFNGSIPESCYISDCYSTVSVTITGTSTAAGFVGHVASFNGYYTYLTNCYSIGTVNGTSNYGFAYSALKNDIVSSCYWDTQASGKATSDDAVGKTTAEMKTQSTYVGWDFTNVWGIDPAKNNGYPYLRICDK